MNKCIISIKTNYPFNTLKILNSINVSLNNISYQNNKIICEVYNNDIDLIKKRLMYNEVVVIKTLGYKRIINNIKINAYYYLCILGCLVIMFIANNMFFNIKIISDDYDLKKEILNVLEEEKIRVFTFKKSYQTLNNKKKIIERKLDDVKWIEMYYQGFNLIIEVIKEDNIKYINSQKYCNLVAKKDGKILSFKVNNGELVKVINDYVYKDEIIVSGDIHLNDEVKNQVCANGKVYAESWYKVQVKIPLVENKINYLNKYRYNIGITKDRNDYKIFKSRLKDYQEVTIPLIELFGSKINLIKEIEYEIKENILSEKEALDKGIELAEEKVRMKLNIDEDILYKKVLKKDIKDSTMYIDIFIVAKENIAKLQVLDGGM